MVLINDKKFACATCIKGHRVSGCTHTDRPLFEVKKKGRPATQCQYCREKRKSSGSQGTVHTKCVCGDIKNPAPTPILIGADGAVTLSDAAPVASSSTATISPAPVPSPGVETKKGQPGSTPTFPNGLRDVHEIAAAANDLVGLSDQNPQSADRKLQNLLNPCNCATTGKCKCCGPKRSRDSDRRIDTRTAHAQVTDSLIEMFKAKATTVTTPPLDANSNSGSSTPQQSLNPSFAGMRSFNLAMTSTNLASPDNRHHPSHTSPHVHKTRLYSPYSSNGNITPRHAVKPRSESMSSTSGPAGWAATTSPSPRPPPSRIRPIADMNRFLGAVFRQDGTVASEIPRSALGLPGIHTFDAMASNGGVKVESMEMDVDAPVSFPTAEDVVIGACTCGDGCQCAGCATHSNPTSSSPKEHSHEGGCGDGCTSCFNCSENVSIPSGVTSIEQLIQVAADKVPKNPPRSYTATHINPLDTRVLPPAAQVSDDAARAYGLVPLLPLQCCNGRCQCAPGECSCEAECCGCCTRCLCEHDGDAVMSGDDTAPSGGCCSTSADTSKQLATCGTSPSNLSPSSAISASIARQPTPVGDSCCSTTPTPPNGLAPASAHRRTASVSRAKGVSNGTSSRRVSVSNGSGVARSTSLTSKSNPKSLALHPAHPRPILPKPQTPNRLALPRSNSSSSRQPSPVHRGSISSQPSSNSSPIVGATQVASQADHLTLPESVISDTASSHEDTLSVPGDPMSSQASVQGDIDDQGGMAVGVDDIANALAASDVDFMAYLNSLLNSSAEDSTPLAGGSASAPAVDQAGRTNYSFAASLAVSSATTDMSLLDLATTTTGQTPRASEYESSMGDIQQLIAGALEQQGVIHRPDAPADASAAVYNFMFNLQHGNNTQPLYDLNTQGGSLMPNMGHLPASTPPMPNHAQVPQAPQPVSFSSQEQNLYYGGFEGFPQQAPQMPQMSMDSSRAGTRTSMSGEQIQQPLQQHLHQQQLPLQQQLPQQQQPHQLPPHQHQQPIPHVQLPQPSNPDIIDLSKPLNPSDVDRILQALLTQQGRQAGTSSSTGQTQPIPVAPAMSSTSSLHPPSDYASSKTTSEQGDPFEDYMYDPVVVDGLPQRSQPGVIPLQPDRDWLEKAWTPSLLGPSAAPPT